MSLALDFLGGAVFTLLYDGVKQALGNTSTFRYLLKDLKFTLESLQRVQATAIQQIGHYNLELGLANDEIEDLTKQMEEGTKLIVKLSDLRFWNYCCINGYTDQLVDLDRSLKRLLENLRLQEARDVKEILDLLRKTRDELDEVKALLQKLMQEKMEGPSASGSNMETAPEPNGGNRAEQGGLAELGAVFGMLFHVVIQMKDKTTIFRPLLGDLKCTLDSLKPMMEEVAQHNNVLNCPKEEQEKLIIQMDKGLELIFKCSKLGLWANYYKYEYTNRLLGLDESLRRQLCVLRAQVAREVKETLASVSIIKTKIKEIKGIGVLKNDVEIESLCKVPEPPSLADDLDVVEVQGTVDVIKGTFVSPRTIEEDGVEGVKGVVDIQNLLEVQVACEVPEPPSPTVGLDLLHVQGTRNEMQDTLVTTIDKVEEVKGIEGSGVTGKQPEIKKSCDVHESPSRFFRRQFSVRSPAKHMRALLARRQVFISSKEQSSKTKLQKSFGYVSGEKIEELGKAKELGDLVEGGAGGQKLYKHFGFSKNLTTMFELGEEVGRGHFSFTCIAMFKKGELEGHHAAVKIISKVKMTTAIAIEDIRREVEILKTLTGHNNIIKFYDAYEDHDNVYIVMEYCAGGDLLDRILARNGIYTEVDARTVMIQILIAVAFCHLQCVVHRDLKPENFLFISSDEDSQIKVIDFGLSDYVKPDQRLNDIVGSAYYVAPEVLHRSYSTEADMWSVGVIAYIMLSGSRPFWARTESGIFRSVLRADPSFDEFSWPSLSTEAKDFVKRLLNKDFRKRMTAAQALNHLWLRNYHDLKVPLDILIFKLMKAYMHSSSLRKSALRALSKTLTPDDLSYMEEQFEQLEPDSSGTIGLENIRMALMKNAAGAVKEGRHADLLASLNVLQYRRMEFQEFCAATLCVNQLEALDQWEQQSRDAYTLFDKDGNKAVSVEELASELDLSPSAHAALHDWIRQTDGKLSFIGFVKLLHGVSGRVP